ncbi:MAG: response regulator [SAR324 cluster bacterium]|nr:response regulator [SAR324 cluster bacterium]
MSTDQSTISKILLLEDWVTTIQLWKKVGEQWQLKREKNFQKAEVYPSEVTPFPNFNLNIEPGNNQYLMRFQGFSTNLKEFSLYEPRHFYQEMVKENISYALILGVLLIMGLYNFFLSVSFKSAEGAYFAAYIFTTALVFIARDRLIETWFQTATWPEWWLSMRTMMFLFFLGFFFQTQYSIKMLGLGRGNKVQLGLIYFFLSLCFLSFPLAFFDNELAQMLANNGAALLVLTLLGLALFHAIKKETKAIFLFISIFPAILGGIMEMMSIQTGTKIIFNPWQLGVCLEIVILSTYLGYRIKILQKQKETSDGQLVETLQSQAVVLEEKVGQRTAELKSAMNIKDKFFSIISHDLRGPIGSLSIMYNEVITSHNKIDEEMFEATKKSTKNLYNMLNELLDWSRSQTGHLGVKPKHFEIKSITIEEQEFLNPQAIQKNITLGLDFKEEIIAYADEDMIKTVIRNLLSNAIKFTPNGGSIDLGATVNEGKIIFFVQDSGKGVDPKLKARLFKLDESVGSSLGTESETGSGLGLILCKEFIDKNQGKIWVDLDLQEGSRFMFTLPLGSKEQMASEQGENSLISLKHISALLVEDNPIHVLSSSEVLKKLGMSFTVAMDGAQALESLAKKPVDLILMDIDMPVMNGITALKAIRKNFSPQPKVIALSSHGEGEYKNALEGASFDGYLNKPLSISDLVIQILELGLGE